MSAEPHGPERRARASFARQGFMRELGVEMTALTHGRCELRLAFRPPVAEQHGFFHGGVVATLADVAAGYAAFSLLPEDAFDVTVEAELNLLAAARGPELVARGSSLKAGRTLTVRRSDVFCREGDEERLCATALGTYMTLPGVAEKDG